MSDEAEAGLEPEESASEEGGGSSKKKKGFPLAALLPNLLKFVAIGLGALIFIVTVSVITFTLLNKGGKSQTVIPENSPYVGTRPQYQTFSNIGIVRTRSMDPTPYTVVVEMVIAYDMGANDAQNELIARSTELQDFVRSFFRTKFVNELQPDNEQQLKREIIELLNTQKLNTAKVRDIYFKQLETIES
ncbi:MAG: flagellar basal body-associated FliL family protein [Treponema sp.]|jgi:flagellar FliL protein|nr:flagellar basal body-associated FliL family protein [Treponema sp.]